MEELLNVPVVDNEVKGLDGYSENIVECFDNVPDIAKPLIGNATKLFDRIESMLYSAPAFIGAVRAAIPEEAYQVILSDEQKEAIARGALKLMTKKDGSLMANLINPKTKGSVTTNG